MTPVSLLWAALLSTCLGASVAQMVTQPQPEVSVREAQTATLDCTYNTVQSDYYLFWYKQPPSGEMIFIIHQEAYKQQNATANRYSVNFQKAAKSFSLRISDSQLEDAAMYFCAYTGPQTGFGNSDSPVSIICVSGPFRKRVESGQREGKGERRPQGRGP
ncbi:TRDV2-1-like protein [Camelus ferus]|nr:TRDV2-1-like protein [Camelus ferus]